MIKARLVEIGSHQAIELPEGYRFAGDHVDLKRVEDGLLVVGETSEWDSFFRRLEMFTEDFMKERDQPETQPRAFFDE